DARAKDRARLVSGLAPEWYGHHARDLGESARRDYRRWLDRFMEAFGDRDIGTLTRGEVKRYLDRIAAKSAATANGSAVVIRRLFLYARDRHDLEHNPVADLRNPAKPKRLSRTLERDEIRVVWRACELAGYPYGHALRFALYTAQRIG